MERFQRQRSVGGGPWRAALFAAAAIVPIGTAAGFEWVHRPIPPAPPVEPRAPSFDRTFDAAHFLKGNIHAHTKRSDGDAAPEDVIAWYRGHGYSFVAITDHNRLTTAASYAALEDDAFRLLSGEEVTMLGAGKQVHVNALCTNAHIGGGTFSSAADALAWATSRIASEGGVAVVNHPNFDKAIQSEDLLAAGAASLLEIMSGHPYVYSLGIAGRPSHEAMWEFALDSGGRFMGVAVDDLHHLNVDADPPAFAGRGWVEVFGDRNNPSVICEALRNGLLYSSTGVTLRRISVSRTEYAVWPEGTGAVVSFIGQRGRTLAELGPIEEGRAASYPLRGGEGYVRAKVLGADGATAWTPAVFLER